MSHQITKEQLDSVSYDDVMRLRCIKDLYARMTDRMTLAQFTKIIAGDMSYKSKAERAKRVSKSRVVHDLADRIIELYTEIQTKAVSRE